MCLKNVEHYDVIVKVSVDMFNVRLEGLGIYAAEQVYQLIHIKVNF